MKSDSYTAEWTYLKLHPYLWKSLAEFMVFLQCTKKTSSVLEDQAHNNVLTLGYPLLSWKSCDLTNTKYGKKRLVSANF